MSESDGGAAWTGWMMGVYVSESDGSVGRVGGWGCTRQRVMVVQRGTVGIGWRVVGDKVQRKREGEKSWMDANSNNEVEVAKASRDRAEIEACRECAGRKKGRRRG